MTSAPLDLISRSLHGDPDEDRLRAALGNLQHTTPLGTDDQAAAIHMLAQVLSINPNADRQTSEERRQIAGYLASFGERVADVLVLGRSRAFTDVSPSCRPLAVTLHTRLRIERQFDSVAPILVAASMRHRHRHDEWMVLATVLEALLRLPADLVEIDRRRLTWYGQQLFWCWLEPGEVATLVHARWIAMAVSQELRAWSDLLPGRRPFVTNDLLAQLVGDTRCPDVAASPPP
jgi:hypothetical protein